MNDQTPEEKINVIIEQAKAKIASNSVSVRESIDNLILSLENASVKPNVHVNSNLQIVCPGVDIEKALFDWVFNNKSQHIAQVCELYQKDINTHNVMLPPEVFFIDSLSMHEKIVSDNLTPVVRILKKRPRDSQRNKDVPEVVMDNYAFISKHYRARDPVELMKCDLDVIIHEMKTEKKARQSAYKEKFFSKRNEKKEVKLNPLLAKLVNKA